jgi:hypothetical protein
VLFRSYFCPGCGRALDSEVTVGDDAPAEDIRLA